MIEDLLKAVREIRHAVEISQGEQILYRNLASICGTMIQSDVLMLTRQGRALQVFRMPGTENILEPYWEKGASLAERRAESLASTDRILENASLRSYGVGIGGRSIRNLIIPLVAAGERVGTMIVCRRDEAYSDEDKMIAEMTSTLAAQAMSEANMKRIAQERLSGDMVRAAFATLSFSELDAVRHIFNEMSEREGILVASRLAQREGLTRSVIVSALRKLESGGIIECRSLGVKGTFIRVLNPSMREELARYVVGA
ncbi:MAG: hypothetical protein IJM90_04760 [Firmicutes bacterium]|nr:hypothetical protein [Bacillota bacterium]